MKRIAGIFLIGLLTVGLWIPANATPAPNTPQWRRGRTVVYQTNRGRRRNGRWYGYKNYGQWRRTQVGNRRYRWQNRYYWRNGRRYTRRIRIVY